jgi:hypothetical protein
MQRQFSACPTTLEEKHPKDSKFLAAGSSLHHKVSRANLSKLVRLLNQMQYEDKGVADMWAFIKKIQTLTGSNKPEEALVNWTANLEIGPETRAPGDNPGSGFDPNRGKGGVATPRSEHLETVSAMIESAETGAQVKWTQVAALLNETLAQHKELTEDDKRTEDDFAEPVLGKWSLTKQGWTRKKKS